MKVIVGADIKIENYTVEAKSLFESLLTFDNPEYKKRVRLGRWVGDTPEKISLVERRGNDLIVPFGMLPVIFKNKKMFPDVENMLKPLRAPSERFEYGSGIVPYQYQLEAITDALRARQGVLVAPCGAGKTQIGLEVAAMIGGRVLWLTHTSDLLRQSMDRAKQCFSLENKDYGTITAGKVDMGRVMTFATVQTMSRIDLDKVSDCFDVVIVDEAHHVCGGPTRVMMFYKVISALKARFKYGLTATPKRADGLSGCMYALLGPKIHEVKSTDVKSATCPVKVVQVDTCWMPDEQKILMPDGTISYSKLMTEIVNDNARNRMIVDCVMSESVHGPCMILTDRVSHIKELCGMLNEHGVSAVGISGTSSRKEKESREQAIKDLSEGKVAVLVATYMLAKEGLDVPSLRCVFFATPQKTDVVVAQAAGRVARKAERKECGYVYDFVDDFGMLVGWYRKRNSIYNRLGFCIGP